MCGSVLCPNEWSKTFLRFTKYIWGAASWLQLNGFGSRLIPLIRSVLMLRGRNELWLIFRMQLGVFVLVGTSVLRISEPKQWLKKIYLQVCYMDKSFTISIYENRQVQFLQIFISNRPLTVEARDIVLKNI